MMGINIFIVTPQFKEHPDWDSMRHAGDYEFAKMIRDLPYNISPTDENYIHPADFSAWRSAVAAIKWDNEGRFEKLLNILESNPNYWIYVSY